jgi:hypothetical protein
LTIILRARDGDGRTIHVRFARGFRIPNPTKRGSAILERGMHRHVKGADTASLCGIGGGAMVVGRVWVATWAGAVVGKVAGHAQGGTVGDIVDFLPLGWVVESRGAGSGVGDGDGAGTGKGSMF